jgi:hypothetical protein
VLSAIPRPSLWPTFLDCEFLAAIAALARSSSRELPRSLFELGWLTGYLRLKPTRWVAPATSLLPLC